jgi:hypothetical protein
VKISTYPLSLVSVASLLAANLYQENHGTDKWKVHNWTIEITSSVVKFGSVQARHCQFLGKGQGMKQP